MGNPADQVKKRQVEKGLTRAQLHVYWRNACYCLLRMKNPLEIKYWQGRTSLLATILWGTTSKPYIFIAEYLE